MSEREPDITLRDYITGLASERAARLQHEVDHARQLAEEVARRLDQRVDYEAKLALERDKRYAERFDAQQAATEYMRVVTNEFRGQLADQQSTFITRSEALTRAQANADKIDALATRIDRQEGRSGGVNAAWLVLVAAFGLVSTIIAIVSFIRR